MSKNKGFTLTELLLASVTGALMMSVVTRLFLSLSYVAHREAASLSYQTSLYESIRFIQDQIRRAGFRGRGKSRLVTDSYDNLYLTSRSLSFRFQSEGKTRFVSVKGDSDEQKLMYCYEILNLESDAEEKKACNRYYSMFDSSELLLTGFEVSESDRGDSTRTTLIALSISAEGKKSSSELDLLVQVFPRNSLSVKE